MSKKTIRNTIDLFLAIKKNNDNSHSYQYLSRMDNGVLVNLEGLMIAEPTTITLQLTDLTHTNYEIAECLIPCGQTTLSAAITENHGKIIVTLTDLNNEPKLEDYNFVIIAKNYEDHQRVVCDPQVTNKGTIKK